MLIKELSNIWTCGPL